MNEENPAQFPEKELEEHEEEILYHDYMVRYYSSIYDLFEETFHIRNCNR